MKTKMALVVMGLLVLAACDRAPFGQTVMTMCEDENRGGELTVLDSAEDGSPRIAVTCRLDSSEQVSILAFDGEGFAPVSWHYADDNVRDVSPGLEVPPTSLLVTLDHGSDRSIIQMAANEEGEVAEPRLVHSTEYVHDDVVISDVDDDGVRDIVLPGQDRWYRNAGTNTEPGPLSRESLRPNHSRSQTGGNVADIDGNGVHDGVYWFKPDGRVELYFQDARETLMVGESLLAEVTDVLGGGDLNGDGVTDLVVATGGMPEALEVRLVVSDGESWQLSEPLPALQDSARVLARDFDGDGALDLITAPRAMPDQDDYSLSYLPGYGDGTFGSAAGIAMPDYPYEIVALPADAPMGPVVMAQVGETGQLVWLEPQPAG